MKEPLLLTASVIRAARPASKEYTLRDNRIIGFGLRVLPSGKKVWELRQHRRRIALGSADTIEVETARARAMAVLGGSEKDWGPAAASITFNMLADKFLSAKEGTYKPSTLPIVRIYIDTQLRKAFGARLIAKITTPDVADWFHGYSSTSPGGANQALGLLKTIFNFARDEGLLPRDAPDICAPIRKNQRAPRGRLLSGKQLERLGQVLSNPPERYRDAADAVRLILLTGCRSGEILRLSWDEVKQERLSLARTKTGHRDVLLSAPARVLLTRRVKVATTAFVFPSPKDKSSSVANIDHQWKMLRSAAGLPDDIRLHDLRHTYASHAIMQGQSLAITGKLLGHADPSSVERYAHLDGTHLGAAADRMANLIGGMMGDV